MTYARLFRSLQRAARRFGFLAARPTIPAASAAPAPVPAAPRREGRFVLAPYTNGSRTRAYKTYIPARDEGQPRPLVVMPHGCQQTPYDFAAGPRMNELAAEM